MVKQTHAHKKSGKRDEIRTELLPAWDKMRKIHIKSQHWSDGPVMNRFI